ncbi:hypoxanthine phosphoribosyltransferase [Candidatus Magnetaquicoccus inordinatus]|uniref:hypoxanthine phosphoribosyltransferase n=1 Tax=Candidatus Magnetaquicoccus inordinatus TaxID=2496818 RepID=UPI00102B35B1|nr:hypoxanthine phosphoribosyltransferase [Candidatus Magnetaquicoccus inordinatus]
MSTPITPLLSEQEIRARVTALAAEIAPHLQPGTVIVALLKGAFVFAADLLRELSRHVPEINLDFMVLSSYGNDTRSSGRVMIKLDCQQLVENQDVLLLDDILDSGNTLTFAMEHMRLKGALRVYSCVLLDKPSRRQTPFSADFVGFTIPDLFVVGYGIDYAERYRELPYIGYLAD